MIKIQVLRVPATLPETYWSYFLSHVSAERREQASRFVHQADAYRSVLGEMLTRVTLSQLTGLRSDELSFTRNAYGKPALSNNPDVPFNVSHSGEWVALISGGTDELGIDIEKVAPIDLQIAERFFSSSECQFLAAMSVETQQDTFYRLWTLKESYIKAVGMGLSMPLNSFAILPNNLKHGELDWSCKQDGQIVRHRFYSQPLDEQHMLAACAVQGELPAQPEIVTLESLCAELV
ncbi:4'-phosphopantetheinyl transferase family protein [Paenibacillus silvae]|uniref:Uncharacterized protein n=1 Tax=Paenibacillus silvae TaxID=1325358 RepID=A0A2W6P4H6_9BACL|nr:4'-phosphopantetheinyl transferase superfamily protein [Paenibacillus silvae]PZT54600.1 hypothetical protein DN757_16390 [Paenibacillus silvae]